MPKISVIMPAYNAEKYIAEAIDSILSQTFRDFEFIILNDCSKDRTEEIILSYDDPRIVYLKNEQNLGVAATLNRGLTIAKGEYIARMDADDISLPQRFEKQVHVLEDNPNVVVCGCGIIPFNHEGKQAVRLFSTDADQSKIDLLFSPCVAHPTVIMRSCILHSNNLQYSLTFDGSEDYALWWELAKCGDIISIPVGLLFYRLHPSQVSKNSNHRRTSFRMFAQQRLLDIDIPVTDQAASTFFSYTCGESYLWSETELKEFIDIVIQIWNTPKDYFNKRKLRRTLTQAIISSIDKAPLSTEKKKNIYAYLRKSGLHISIARIKQTILRQLRR